jgi:hypothetical protein
MSNDATHMRGRAAAFVGGFPSPGLLGGTVAKPVM